MTRRERNLLIFLSIVIIIAGYYYFIFQNQLDTVITLKDDIVTQDSQIKLFETSKTSIKNLNLQKEEILLSLNESFGNYLGDIEQEEVILLINEIILRSDVNITGLSFTLDSPEELEVIPYEVIGVSIDMSGNYMDIVNFMSSFWRFDQNIFVQNMNLSNNEGVITGSIDIAFVKVNNEFASSVELFEWYQDNFYIKDDPFDESDFSAIFKPNYFYTGTDVEFYNPPYETFNDIHGHWAEEIITFFGRNGYIVGDEDNNVYPDEQMTRLETMILLDLVFRWELVDDFVALETFDDYAEIASLDDVEKKTLLKAYNSGYLFGYDDNTLRPNNKITYEELGYIGANLLENDQVTWLEVALEIEEKFGYSSTGLVDEKLYATKAEIIYFLSYIDNKEQE